MTFCGLSSSSSSSLSKFICIPFVLLLLFCLLRVVLPPFIFREDRATMTRAPILDDDDAQFAIIKQRERETARGNGGGRAVRLTKPCMNSVEIRRRRCLQMLHRVYFVKLQHTHRHTYKQYKGGGQRQEECMDGKHRAAPSTTASGGGVLSIPSYLVCERANRVE